MVMLNNFDNIEMVTSNFLFDYKVKVTGSYHTLRFYMAMLTVLEVNMVNVIFYDKIFQEIWVGTCKVILHFEMGVKTSDHRVILNVACRVTNFLETIVPLMANYHEMEEGSNLDYF